LFIAVGGYLGRNNDALPLDPSVNIATTIPENFGTKPDERQGSISPPQPQGSRLDTENLRQLFVR
jgi:hypothetical protein